MKDGKIALSIVSQARVKGRNLLVDPLKMLDSGAARNIRIRAVIR